MEVNLDKLIGLQRTIEVSGHVPGTLPRMIFGGDLLSWELRAVSRFE